MFFKHFASTNQLPSFYINGTLVENGLNMACTPPSSSWGGVKNFKKVFTERVVRNFYFGGEGGGNFLEVGSHVILK